MTVTTVRKDPQALSLTLEAEFDASPERVWQLWADPRHTDMPMNQFRLTIAEIAAGRARRT